MREDGRRMIHHSIITTTFKCDAGDYFPQNKGGQALTFRLTVTLSPLSKNGSWFLTVTLSPLARLGIYVELPKSYVCVVLDMHKVCTFGYSAQ
jgi:hypothetical protein